MQPAIAGEIGFLSGDSTLTGDQFGRSVSISDSVMLIGTPRSDVNGIPSGSAYIVESSIGNQTQQLLTASDGAAGDQFGFAVSIDNQTAVVTAPNDDDNGASSGAAYVFEKVSGLWIQTAKLVPIDGSARDNFGTSAAIHGNRIIIGAYRDDEPAVDSGSAFIFEKVSGSWTEVTKVSASNGGTGDRFGQSVALYNNLAIVGAFYSDAAGTDSGTAYIYRFNGTTWAEEATLIHGNSAARDRFGVSVALDSSTAIVGAIGTDLTGPSSGSAIVFTEQNGVWVESQTLVAANAAAGDTFGRSISFDGQTIVIGSPQRDDQGSQSGSLYAFRLNGAS